MADMDEIATLLHIAEKAHVHGHANIAGAARERLKQIDAEHPNFAPDQPPEPITDEEETDEHGE